MTGVQTCALPIWPQGLQGPAGTGLNNRGAWVSGTTYEPGDYVFAPSTSDPLVNSMWIVQQNESFVSTIEPNIDTVNWIEFQAPQGEQGHAFTTIAAAHTTASTGDVIEVSGGASGKSYSLAGFTFTKGVTVQGSKTAGHSGLMTLTGRLYFNNAADGVITLINGQFKDLAVAEFIYPEQYYANSVDRKSVV